jgi:hypothetical protein
MRGGKQNFGFGLFPDFPRLEGVFESLHIDTAGEELDAFQFEAGALLVGGGSAEFDVAAGAEDAMPGERVRWIGAEETGDGAMIARVSGCGCDCSVSADFAGGDGEDHAAEGEVALFVRAEGRAEELAFAAFEEELIHGEGLRWWSALRATADPSVR